MVKVKLAYHGIFFRCLMHHWNGSISLWPSPPGRHCFVSRSPLESSRQGPGGKRAFVELKRQTERERERERELFGQKEYTSWHKPTQARLASLYQSSAPLASAHDVWTSFTMFYMSSCLDMFGILWLYCSDLQYKVCKATDASNQNTEICAELCSRSNGKASVARPGSTVAIRYRAIHQDELILMPVPAETHQTWGSTVCSDQWMFGPTDQVDGSRKPLKVLKAIHPIAFKISKPLTSTT